MTTAYATGARSLYALSDMPSYLGSMPGRNEPSGFAFFAKKSFSPDCTSSGVAGFGSAAGAAGTTATRQGRVNAANRRMVSIR